MEDQRIDALGEILINVAVKCLKTRDYLKGTESLKSHVNSHSIYTAQRDYVIAVMREIDREIISLKDELWKWEKEEAKNDRN